MLFQLLIKSVLVSGFFFHFATLNAQFKIKVEISDSSKTEIKLLGFYGAETFLIEQKYYSENSGIFEIKPSVFYEGFYRIQFNDSLVYDFIATKNDSLFISADLNQFRKTLEIKWNTNNQQILNFKKELHSINIQISTLQNINHGDENMMQAIGIARQNLIAEKNNLVDKYCETFDNPVFCRLIKMTKSNPNTNQKLSFKQYFQEISFGDSAILRTNVYPELIINFFAFHTNLDEYDFKRYIDSVLLKSIPNKLVYEYNLYFFLNLFGKAGPEVIFQYLLENYYQADACGMNLTDKDLIGRINKFITLLPGNKSPILNGKTVNDLEIDFTSEINKNENTILFFWNPDCHYCKEIIPKLIENKFVNLISFAITNESDQWKYVQQKMGFNWIDISDGKGWDSENVKNFMVTKTPFFIKVNKEGIIQQYDVSAEEILKK